MNEIMYCAECKKFFWADNMKTKHTTYESYYGVSSEFPDSHSMAIGVCPLCGSDQIEDVYDDDIVDLLNGDTKAD